MNAEAARMVVARVLHQIAPEVDLATVPDDVELQEELDLDSMDFLNLVTGVAEATGVEIPESDYRELATLAGWVAYLSDR